VGTPPGSDIDAAFLIGGDNGDLVISFDVPTDLSGLGGANHDPSDLIQFTRTGPGCGNWALVGPFFTGSGANIPLYADVTGADERHGDTIITFDVPTTLTGAAPPTFVPGELANWNGVSLTSYYAPAAWPVNLSSRVDAFTFLPDPGTVPATGVNALYVNKSPSFPPNIVVSWGPSTSVGATDYGIYEGTLLSFPTYTHTAKVCGDAGGDFQEDFAPQVASSYYLVVPYNPNDEGSYGQSATPTPAERPVGTTTCVPTQALGCP
jgi:hypothetical protein